MTAREKLLPLLEEKGADCALLLDEVSIRWLTRFAASDGAAVVDRTVVRLLVDPRYYKTDLSALFQEKQVTDLLVLYNVNGFGEEKTVAAVLPQLLK